MQVRQFSRPVSSGIPVLYSYVQTSTAVSDEAETLRSAAFKLTEWLERSQTLFGSKNALLSELRRIAEDCSNKNWDNMGAEAIDPRALRNVDNLIRTLPDDLPLPQLAPEPDGSLSLDWIRGPYRLYSLSVGRQDFHAYAWVNGAESGHGVIGFDGINLRAQDIDRIIEVCG